DRYRQRVRSFTLLRLTSGAIVALAHQKRKRSAAVLRFRASTMPRWRFWGKRQRPRTRTTCGQRGGRRTRRVAHGPYQVQFVRVWRTLYAAKSLFFVRLWATTERSMAR